MFQFRKIGFDHRFGLQRRAKRFIGPVRFDGSQNGGADVADMRPFLRQRRIVPARRNFRENFQMNALRMIEQALRAVTPCLFRREAQDRREPGRQAFKHMRQNGATSAALEQIGPVAVKPVLADVEIKRR